MNELAVPMAAAIARPLGIEPPAHIALATSPGIPNDLTLRFSVKSAQLDAIRKAALHEWLITANQQASTTVEVVAFAEDETLSRSLGAERLQTVALELASQGISPSRLNTALVITDHPGRRVQLHLRSASIEPPSLPTAARPVAEIAVPARDPSLPVAPPGDSP